MKKIYAVFLALALFCVQQGWAEHKKHNHAQRIFLDREHVHKVHKRIWLFLDGDFYIAKKIHFKGHLPYAYKKEIKKVRMGPYFRARKSCVETPRSSLRFEHPVNYRDAESQVPLPLFSQQ